MKVQDLINKFSKVAGSTSICKKINCISIENTYEQIFEKKLLQRWKFQNTVEIKETYTPILHDTQKSTLNGLNTWM